MDMLDNLYAKSNGESISEEDIIVIPDLFDAGPLLHDFFRFEYWKGEPVDPPSIRYSVRGGRLSVTLSDGERKRYATFECKTLRSGLETIERAIENQELSRFWKSWGPLATSKKKSAKRS